MKKIRKIVILGPQASGKGTQAEFLAREYKIPHISTGEISRQEARKKTKFGKFVANLINNGFLVPDNIINKIVKNRLRKTDARKGFIFDGYPRNIIQAKALEKMTSLDIVIELHIPDKVSLARIADRRVCSCEKIYHLKFKPPKRKGICDYCGKKLIIREDETPKAIKERLSIYHRQTEILFNYYRKRGILVKVDGRPTIHIVKKLIKKAITDFSEK
jgi:adenylate kinase